MNITYQLEAKKDGLKQVQSGDVKLTLTIQALDMPNALYSDAMGQRYVVVMVPINDDETPKLVSEARAEERGSVVHHTALGEGRDSPKSYAGHAKLLCQEDEFIKWIGAADSQEAEAIMKARCAFKSCAELIEGSDALERFKKLRAEYNESYRKPPLSAYEN